MIALDLTLMLRRLRATLFRTQMYGTSLIRFLLLVVLKVATLLSLSLSTFLLKPIEIRLLLARPNQIAASQPAATNRIDPVDDHKGILHRANGLRLVCS